MRDLTGRVCAWHFLFRQAGANIKSFWVAWLWPLVAVWATILAAIVVTAQLDVISKFGIGGNGIISELAILFDVKNVPIINVPVNNQEDSARFALFDDVEMTEREFQGQCPLGEEITCRLKITPLIWKIVKGKVIFNSVYSRLPRHIKFARNIVRGSKTTVFNAQNPNSKVFVDFWASREAKVGSQAARFIVTGDISLVAGPGSGEYCYPERNLFKQSMAAIFSIVGACAGIAGFWIVFFGIDQRCWRKGWRLSTALALSAFLIVGGWFTQAIYPLPVALSAEYASVFCGSSGVSATRYRRTEDVGVFSVVIPKLKLGDVERQIFTADFVEASHDAALQQRPEAIDCLSVHHAIDVLLRRVPNEGVRIAAFQMPVTRMFVGGDQAHVIGNRVADETIQRVGIGIVDDASDDIAFALCGTDDNELASDASARLFLVPMPIAVGTADVSFIDFDNAAQFGFRFDQRSADFVAHGMSSSVGTEAHHPLDLQRAHALFAREHVMNDPEPVAERFIRVFEDSPSNDGEPIALVRRANIALPFERHGFDWKHFVVVAARTNDPERPAPSLQVGAASFLIGESRLELSGGHLRDWFWTACHDVSPIREIMA